MGAHLEVYKTKKANIVNNLLLIDESYKELGEIDCSYHSMNNYCKGSNIIELQNRKDWDDSIYHIADDDNIESIKYCIDNLNYDKESEIIIVVYDNA